MKREISEIEAKRVEQHQEMTDDQVFMIIIIVVMLMMIMMVLIMIYITIQ